MQRLTTERSEKGVDGSMSKIERLINNLQQALERQNSAECDKAGGSLEEQHDTSSDATGRENGKTNNIVAERITEALNKQRNSENINHAN